jgi:hypothetical protein
MVVTQPSLLDACVDATEGEASIYSTFEQRKVKQRGVEQPVGPVLWEPYGRR